MSQQNENITIVEYTYLKKLNSNYLIGRTILILHIL